MQNFQEHSDRQINGLKWVVQEISGTVILPGAVWNAGRRRQHHVGHEAGNPWTWIFMWIDVAMRPETNSSYWKMDGWKTILSFWVLANFQGQIVSFRENIIYFHWREGHVPALPFYTTHCRLMYQVDFNCHSTSFSSILFWNDAVWYVCLSWLNTLFLVLVVVPEAQASQDRVWCVCSIQFWGFEHDVAAPPVFFKSSLSQEKQTVNHWKTMSFADGGTRPGKKCIWFQDSPHKNNMDYFQNDVMFEARHTSFQNINHFAAQLFGHVRMLC